MGSACELECETILSFDLAFITESLQERILAALIEIKRMLSGLMQSLLVPARKGQAERGNARIRETSPTPRGRASDG